MRYLLTPGQRSDQHGFAPLVEDFKGATGERGRPRNRPRKIVTDKAYGARVNRHILRQRRIGCVIPWAHNQRRRGSFDRDAYRQRNQVERFFARIKHFRRIVTRYEKLARHYLAMVTLASIAIWLRELT